MSALAAVNSLNPSNVKTSSRFPTFIRGFLSLFVNSPLQRRSDLGQVSWRHREERRGAAAGVVSRKQNLSNRFQQLSPGEGLYQRSGKLEPRASVQLLRGQFARHQDDRQCHARGTQLLDKLHAGHLWHVVVGDQEVVPLGMKSLPGGCAVLGDVHPVAEWDQRSGTEFANLTIVIDHEYVTGRIRLASRC